MLLLEYESRRQFHSLLKKGFIKDNLANMKVNHNSCCQLLPYGFIVPQDQMQDVQDHEERCRSHIEVVHHVFHRWKQTLNLF